MLLRSEEFRKFLVTMRPDALPDLMAIKLRLRFDFSDKVLRDLIADSGSRLYQEIERNQNLADKGGYAVPEANVLLWFLFGDAKVATNSVPGSLLAMRSITRSAPEKTAAMPPISTTAPTASMTSDGQI
ncbi:hypothetical protein [Sinorhizobium fredii]|uniref:Uncharacterized protein n=1 Tax=Rhizobium fredii TaxID=380 RepID=A0A2L0HCU3_RHIFR|nr:hypothetical protein [Sinorhizobium fredii]AUX79286.1 hypothetical protein NXT3_PC00106 [Sinorhizobium fredii]